MSSIRQRRIADQIQEEISALLLKGLKDPRIGFVTITGVEVTGDLQRAWVYFGTPGDAETREQSRDGLQSAAGFIRRELGKRMRLKSIPELEFRYDESLDRGARIEHLLSEVREREGWDDPGRLRGSLEEVAEALQSANRLLVTTHLNPDGDALGALLGTGLILGQLGKQATLYLPDPVPLNFRFLPGTETIQAEPGAGPFDATVVLDCSELPRVGPLPPPEQRGVLIGLDHHLTLKPLGDRTFLDPTASSLGEMLFRLLDHLPATLDLPLAICLYTSILTDTGSFHYSNTTPQALRAAADMVACGVQPWEIAREVYESQPLSRLRLLQRVLPTLEVDPSGLYSWILVERCMLEETGATEDMLDGFINYPRGIERVEVAIQYREVDDTRYKASFRSRGRINVAQIAERFGGGGHANAAGCTIEGSQEVVQAKVSAAVEEALAELE